MKENKWENYGDINPLEGGVYVRKDRDVCYDVLKVVYIEDVGGDACYMIQDMCFDLDALEDGWIDKKAVMDFIGMSEDDINPILLMLGAIDYYGAVEFGDTASQASSCNEVGDYLLYENEVIKQLKEHGIDCD